MANREYTPRLPRVDTAMAGTLRDTAGDVFDVTVLNVSANGLRLHCSEDLVQGEVLDLHLAAKREKQAIEIVWARGREAGAVFISPPTPIP